MPNIWGIPKATEDFVIKRDLFCVYCGVDFSINHESRKTRPTWEHIVNDIKISTIENICLCCTSCNSSKGAKTLLFWLKSNYCISKGISEKTVAEVVQKAIKNPPQLNIIE
jgi:hypothetical protein